MSRRLELPTAIGATGVFAVIRKPTLPVGTVAGALAAGGIRAIEVTVDTPDAVEAIRDLVDGRPHPDVLVGAGTVTTPAQLEAVLAAGAEFVVTPVVVTEVVDRCVERSVPVFPGALTPTEITTAWDRGATGVKVFPVGPLGAGYLAACRGPLAAIPLFAVGAVDADNAAAFVAAGAVGVGVGTWLTGPGRAEEITARAGRLLAVVRAAR